MSKKMTRREFLNRSAIGMAAGSVLLSTNAASYARIMGANDTINLAIIGIRGRGGGLMEDFAKLEKVRVKYIVDVDENLFESRVQQLEKVTGYRPETEWDMRKVYEDKDVDAVVIATTNHWHALATIWAAQAGKHVYVEKPSSHNVWEGRKMVEAARKYNVLVEVGFQNRSRINCIKAMKFIQDGKLGKIYMAKGLCFKPRANIGKYPDGPMKEGEKYRLHNETDHYQPAYSESYLSKVHYDMWLGPAPKRPFNRNRFHYNWHWHWDYGNGDTGNQGPHQFDAARWGLNKNEYPVKIGNLFFGTEGWMQMDAGGNWETFFGRNNETGPTSGDSDEEEYDPMNLVGAGDSGHINNFIAAVRSNKLEYLTCDVEVGHLSSALPLIANISYQLGRELRMDGKNEKFIEDKEADKMLKREYRAPYIVSEKV